MPPLLQESRTPSTAACRAHMASLLHRPRATATQAHLVRLLPTPPTPILMAPTPLLMRKRQSRPLPSWQQLLQPT